MQLGAEADAHGKHAQQNDLSFMDALSAQVDCAQQSAGRLERAQDAALEALEAEHSAVDEALRRLDDVDAQQRNDNEELVLETFEEGAPRLQPLLHAAHVEQVPLLRRHAQERRLTRSLLSSPQWSAQDVESLHAAIASERIRLQAMEAPSNEPDWRRVARYVPFHTPSDCRTRWTFVERPDVNQTLWSAAEKKALATVVAESEQAGSRFSWEDAAAALGSGRTGYQALEAYQRGVKPAVHWTEERDDALLHAASECGPEWKAVAERLGLPAFCASMCHKRHSQLKGRHLVHGRWSASEDAALRAAVATHGCNWKRVEMHVPGRSGQQCRERWVGRLANIPEGASQAARRTWTPEEDDRLRACAARCKSWVQIAECVGGRSDKMVRERWLLLQRREEESRRRGDAGGSAIRGDDNPPPARRGLA